MSRCDVCGAEGPTALKVTIDYYSRDYWRCCPSCYGLDEHAMRSMQMDRYLNTPGVMAAYLWAFGTVVGLIVLATVFKNLIGF